MAAKMDDGMDPLHSTPLMTKWIIPRKWGDSHIAHSGSVVILPGIATE
jgi:hypothetical protein